MQQLSPALQRAIFLAMARELGWLPPASQAGADGITLDPGSSNSWNVDFVDLRPGATNLPPPKLEIQDTVNQSAAPAPALGAAIPAFISGNNLIMAIDSSIAAKGSYVGVSTGSAC